MLVVKERIGAEELLLQHESDLGELCRQLGHFLKAERQLRTDEVATLRDKLEAILLTAAAMQGNTGCHYHIYHNNNTFSTAVEKTCNHAFKDKPTHNMIPRLPSTHKCYSLTLCPTQHFS